MESNNSTIYKPNHFYFSLVQLALLQNLKGTTDVQIVVMQDQVLAVR